MKLGAVVVTYNRLVQIEATVARLLAEPLDVLVVVDNGSTDGSREFLRRLDDPRLDLIESAENVGGAGGFEAGLRHVMETHDPDWVVVMDDDARPRPGALARFRETAPDAPDVGAVAAAVENPDGSICEMNRPSLNPFWHGRVLGRAILGLSRGDKRGFHIPDAAYAPGAGQSEIDVASFVGFFVARRAVARIGLPDGGYFIYGDDVTYSLRLRRSGLRIVFDPGLRFAHHCGTLSVDLATRPLWKVYYLSRNGVQMTRWAAGWFAPLAFGYYLAVWLRKARLYEPGERPLYRRLMWRGVRHGLAGRKGRDARAHALSGRA